MPSSMRGELLPAVETSGRERVRRAIDFDCPDRIPRSSQKREGDTRFVNFSTSPRSDGDPELDEWGCRWSSTETTQGHQGLVTGHPLSEWTAFARHKFPDPLEPGRFSDLTCGSNPVASESVRFVVGSLQQGPMHLLDNLLGFEQFMVFLADYPERISRLLEATEQWLHGLVEGYSRVGWIDALILYDDQAMQTGPYFSMDLWRELFKPVYRRLCRVVHDKGMKMLFHSCGNIAAHLPELADCGVDMIDNKQPSLWMLDPVVDTLRGRMGFHTCLDMARLFDMETKEVPEEVHRLIRALGTPRGGFMGTVFNLENPALARGKLDALWDAYETFRWEDAE